MSDTAQLERQILADVAAAGDETALEAVRVAALGKQGSISALLKTLGAMAPEERKSQGPLINGLKDRVNAALAERREAFKHAALEARLNTESVDVTLPVREAPFEIGRVHPITQVTDELTAIFADMGFAVAEGPDIETEDYNFTKLNFPDGHPARDMHDTFFFNPKEDGSRLLLRTHTSPVQVRTMLSQKPPIRVIIPGRTYRCDCDQTHTPMFHQVEGLVIDSGSHLGHLKWISGGVLQSLLRSRSGRHALSSLVLSVHRALARGRHPVPARQRRSPLRRRQRLDGNSRLRHGAPERVEELRARSATSTRVSPGAWGSTVSPCSNTACRISAPSSKPMCAGFRTTASARSICRRWPQV